MEINGKKVVDAKRHLTVNVNEMDCRQGQRKDAASCAAAVAIVREQPGVLNAKVYRGCTYVEREKHWERYITPTTLKFELSVFDRGAKFMPGKHTLGAPTNTAQSLENIREYSQNRPKATAKKAKARIAKTEVRPRNPIGHIRPRGANR